MGPADLSSLGMSPSSPGTRGPQRKGDRGRGALCFHRAGVRYLGFQAAGGRRRRWLLCSCCFPGQPVPAVLTCTTWRDHCGRERCGAPGGIQAHWTSVLPQCRVPGMSIPPGGGVCPGASPGQVLPTSRASAPPCPAPAATSLQIASVSSRDCRPPQRAGGPELAPWRMGGGGSGRGCVV